MSGLVKWNKLFAVICVAAAGFLLAACDSPEERAQGYYERGQKLLEAGELSKASVEFRNALKLKEDFVPPLYGLAKIEQQNTRFPEAVQLLKAVIERDPKHRDALVDLANIYLLAGELPLASKHADQAYELAPDSPRVLALKAAIALKLEKRQEAVQFADAALKIEPDNVDALLIKAAERIDGNKPAEALPFLDRAEAKNEREIGVLFFRIKALTALKDDAGVEQVLKRLAGYYPDNMILRYGLVRWYLAAGRKDDAERTLREFAADNPTNTEAALNLVGYLQREKGSDAAREELSRRIAAGGEVFTFRMALAQSLFADGQRDAALEKMKALVAEEKDAENGVKARIQLAGMYLAMNNVGAASEYVDQILTSDGKNVDGLIARARILLIENKLDNAVADLIVASNEAPQNTDILLLMAEAYERQGAVELAEENLVKATRIDEFNPRTGLTLVQFLLRQSKIDQAERVLTEMQERAPKDRQVLTALAQVKLRKQDWVGSEEISRQLRDLGGADEAADQIRAAALSGQNKFDQSIELLEGMLSKDSTQKSQLGPLVQAYVRGGQVQKARDLLDGVLRENPKNVQAHVLYGALHQFSGDEAQAEKAFQAAITADEKDSTGYQALAEFYLRSGRAQEAEAVLRKGLEQAGERPAILLLLAASLESSAQFDKAIELYEDLYRRDPKSGVVANNLASLLSDHRRDEASLQRAFDIAQRFRNSNMPQFKDTLGWIMLLRGEKDKAVSLLKAAADDLPNMAVVQFHMGLAYKAIGERDLALAALEKSLSLDRAAGRAERAEAAQAIKELQAMPKNSTN